MAGGLWAEPDGEGYAAVLDLFGGPRSPGFAAQDRRRKGRDSLFLRPLHQGTQVLRGCSLLQLVYNGELILDGRLSVSARRRFVGGRSAPRLRFLNLVLVIGAAEGEADQRIGADEIGNQAVVIIRGGGRLVGTATAAVA